MYHGAAWYWCESTLPLPSGFSEGPTQGDGILIQTQLRPSMQQENRRQAEKGMKLDIL